MQGRNQKYIFGEGEGWEGCILESILSLSFPFPPFVSRLEPAPQVQLRDLKRALLAPPAREKDILQLSDTFPGL